MFAGVFVGVEVGLDNVVFVVVDCSVVLSVIGKSKYAGFSLSMGTVFKFAFYGKFKIFVVSFQLPGKVRSK